MVLPSYGSFTGGLNIDHPEIRSFIKKKFKIYILSQKKIFKFLSSNVK